LAGLQCDARDVVIDGKRLETLRYSSRASHDSSIVMLHEGLGSVAMWRDFPEQLADRTGCQVLLYSRYGHGKSQRLAEKRSIDFMHHEAELVLPQLLDCFQIPCPILLGHSDGGSIALIYAATHPSRLPALILEAPHVFVEDVSVQSIAKIGEAYKLTDLPLKLRRYHDHPDEMFWGWNDIWLDPQFRAWNIEKCLSSIKCPVLVIQGEQDEYGTPSQLDLIKKHIRQARTVVLPDCGHSPHRDQPMPTLAAISTFVEELT
jgi:pimeloyl-ACP methyl ester carboxylesterase